MIKKAWNIYKTQILVAITLTIVLVALEVVRSPRIIITIALGTILSVFTLDLDYIFYAYFIEPSKPFSENLRGYIGHRDYGGALEFIQHNFDEVTDKTLNSAFFQILLAGITIMAVSSTSGVFVKAFILGTFANSIYRYTEFYFDGKTREWFWALKNTPAKNGALLYGGAMLLVLIYSVTLF